MDLVIAEKPSVAMSIAKIIGANSKKDGYVEGENYIVSWCVGHLVGLSNAESYYEKYAKWNLENLPIIPKEFKTEILKNTKKQFLILKKLMSDNRVNNIICATDAGREGELIFRLLYEKTGCKKNIKRLWISSMEDEAIKNGFNNLKNGDCFIKLYESAYARAKADWLIGINGTRLYSLKYGDILGSTISVGRVMTPTLNMISKRTTEIKTFVPTEFFTIASNINGIVAESERFVSLNEAKDTLNALTSNKVICTKSDVVNKCIKAPLPYDLTTLQREANRFYGFTSQKTLNITQKLYENKQVTYPRTDSRYITEDMIKASLELGNKISNNNYDPSKIANNSKVNDHHAIIPTFKSLEAQDRGEDENKIYNLIKMRFLCSMLPDGIDVKGSYEFKVDNLKLKANQTSFKTLGYRELENNFLKKESEQSELIDIKEGEEFNFNPEIKSGLTSSPKQYTEDTLLSAMERAGNEDLDKSLDTEKKGIGTPATRAGIIEKLINLNYIKREKKKLISTELGDKIIEIIPEILKSAKLTAEWENELTKISDGTVDEKDFMENIEKMVYEIVNNTEEVKIDMNEKSLGKCTRCKEGNIVSRGKVYVCDNDCGWKIFKDNIWWNNKNKKLTDEILEKILSQGEVRIEGFKSNKTGGYYDANVSLEDTGQYINFVMNFNKEG